MRLAFNTLIQSLRMWHITPLLLPFLLGSAALRVSPYPPITKTVVPPLSITSLLNHSQFSSPQTPDLPSRALNTLSQHQHPSAKQASQPSAPQKPKTQSTYRHQPPSPSAQAAIAPKPAPTPAHHLPPIPIRVAVAIDSKTLTVATSDTGIVVDQSGRALGQLTAQTGMAVGPSATGLQIGTLEAPSGAWIKPSTTDGLVYVDGRWYRGPVQLISQANGLLAVNHTDVETYLYSVVGAEMPAYWPVEALKAQAIAARSYAIVHISRPASDYYDLGSSTRWQAYNGAETETNTTHIAVNETRGILLSYQGGVVESLYASSEQLVKEAHGGFGMSQEGANQLAQQNFNFQQILGRFYPGTSLAVLNIK
jgi:stage II sporulation protein D